jgi:alpha-beta hydrolase superfamily lysophospholipase
MTEMKEFYRRAANGEGQIVSYRWNCENPRAVVQFVHDISDHASRYNDFAVTLAEAGYDVYANDITGHGMSKQGHRGAFAMKPDGLQYVLEDIDTLFEYACEGREEIPKIIIGTGFGAALAELYASGRRNVSALVAIASMSVPRLTQAIMITAENHIRIHGYNEVSMAVHNMIYQLNRRAGSDPAGIYYWISSDENEMRKYIDDVDCGFPLTSSGYLEVLKGLRSAAGRKGLENIDDIPVLLVSGSEDQLGECGRAVSLYAGQLADTDHDQVAFKLYKGCYHDILHDTCSELVQEDICSWLESNGKQLD